MKQLGIALLVLSLGCHGAPKSAEQTPDWLAARIKGLEDSSGVNPPELVASYSYQGHTVYYVAPRCCDQYSVLYDSSGAELCAPDGGITGRGDGRCPEFVAQRTNEKILWRPPAARGAASLTAAPDSAQPDTTIPEQFRGRWAGRQTECGRAAESSLRVTADSVNFYASRGRVLAVDVMKDREIEVLLESSGEGQVWRQTRRFKLSEDGRSLTDLTTEGHVVRGRCNV